MDCPEIAERLGAYVDRELDPADAQALAAHLGACSECRTREGRLAGTVRLLERTFGGYKIARGIDPLAVAAMCPAREEHRTGGSPAWLRWTFLITCLGLGMCFAADLCFLRMAIIDRWRSATSELWIVVEASTQVFALLLLICLIGHTGVGLRRPGGSRAIAFRWTGLALLPPGAFALIVLALVTAGPFGLNGAPVLELMWIYRGAIYVLALTYAGWLAISGLTRLGNRLDALLHALERQAAK